MGKFTIVGELLRVAEVVARVVVEVAAVVWV